MVAISEDADTVQKEPKNCNFTTKACMIVITIDFLIDSHKGKNRVTDNKNSTFHRYPILTYLIIEGI